MRAHVTAETEVLNRLPIWWNLVQFERVDTCVEISVFKKMSLCALQYATMLTTPRYLFFSEVLPISYFMIDDFSPADLWLLSSVRGRIGAAQAEALWHSHSSSAPSSSQPLNCCFENLLVDDWRPASNQAWGADELSMTFDWSPKCSLIEDLLRMNLGQKI